MIEYVVMARWPSWLWREVKVTLTEFSSWSNPRGFKSHSCQFIFCPFVLVSFIYKMSY
ncbi:hypothetical protein F5Y09DRAFT_293818 [Xylaria sp. FL1042]|nr:hypothetical protein F5Y09DRAFT_293818 [Xylaria sp. FL1042]